MKNVSTASISDASDAHLASPNRSTVKALSLSVQTSTACIYAQLGQRRLRFRDACKQDIKSAQISIESWEPAAADRNNWYPGNLVLEWYQECRRKNKRIVDEEKRSNVGEKCKAVTETTTQKLQQMIFKTLMSLTAQLHYLSR